MAYIPPAQRSWTSCQDVRMTGRSLGRHSMARFQSSESAVQDLVTHGASCHLASRQSQLGVSKIWAPKRSKWVKAVLLVLVAFTTAGYLSSTPPPTICTTRLKLNSTSAGCFCTKIHSCELKGPNPQRHSPFEIQ